MRRWQAWAVTVVALAGLAGCQAAPRQRPVKMGPVGEGPGTLAYERAQLQGEWALVEVTVFPEPGKSVTLKAVGRLVYDEFSNLKASGQVAGVGNPQQYDAYITVDGRAELDPVGKRLLLRSLEGNPQAITEAAPQIAPDRIRYYEFVGDLLKLSIKDASGRVTGAVTWRRVK